MNDWHSTGAGVMVFHNDGSYEVLADASEDTRRQFVENVFKPVGDDVEATIQDRARVEDEKNREIFQRVKEIHRTVPDVVPVEKPKVVLKQPWARKMVATTGAFFGAIQKAFEWLGKRTVS